MTGKTITVDGPEDFAVKLWETNIHPALVQLNRLSERQKALFYIALAGQLYGTMAADFGHDRAMGIMRAVLDEFSRMRGELHGSATQ